MVMATSDDLSPGLERLEVDQIIEVAVLNDMRLLIAPIEIARGGEHNSATFRIIQQPASLDGYVCRAEVETSEGTTYRLVTGGEFSLTSDISIPGIGSLQLVYSEGAAVIRKSYPARFHVTRSINAVDPSDPEYENGLAQLQIAAFAQVQGSDTAATFYNISGQPVGVVVYPPGQGGGLDEATANLLYLRQDGSTAMSGSVAIMGPNRGITWEASGLQGAFYSTGSQLVMRRPVGDPDILMESNSGAAATRSPILTQVMGDARYVQPLQLDPYLLRSGGQMSGPLITVSGGSVTNPGLGVGDNTTGFYRVGNSLGLTVGGGLFAQWLQSPASMMCTVPLNMATFGISNVATPVQPGDAANRSYVDTAVANVPRQLVPAARTYLGNEVSITVADQVFFEQPFFTNDNASRTILITVQPEFDGGVPSQFTDLIYTTNLSVGLQSKVTVYGTAAGYMHGTACFAATVTPVSAQIQVQLSVRAMAVGATALIQVGSRTNLRSYVTIQEMTT